MSLFENQLLIMLKNVHKSVFGIKRFFIGYYWKLKYLSVFGFKHKAKGVNVSISRQVLIDDDSENLWSLYGNRTKNSRSEEIDIFFENISKIIMEYVVWEYSFYLLEQGYYGNVEC